MADELLVFLHGLGQTPQNWQEQVEQLPADLPAAAPWLRGTRPGGQREFSVADAVSEVSAVLLQHGAQRAYLCGHGLGALVALHCAVHDERVAGLVLSAPQVNPPRWAIAAQRLAVRAMSRRRLAERGIDKGAMLRMLDTLADGEANPPLRQISTPALVLAGARDRAGAATGRLVAAELPNARMELMDGVGEAPSEAPARFNELLFGFVGELRGGRPA
ncbi:alpha/beta hydrolase [Naumannella sp. ID2617S]|nr:alpha/beta hydrolase [Naumannella sp. ID2617S]